jgi:dTMP kinase
MSPLSRHSRSTRIPPGKFITFEGIEGSGKSLQLKLLGTYLDSQGIPYTVTREPGGTPFGMEVRTVLLAEKGAPRVPEAELLLYLADRFQDLKEVIEPSLEKGIHVLGDRYHDATRAYQGAARGISPSLLEALSRLLQIRKPDLTLVFDLPVEVGLTRARQRNKEESSSQGRFEAECLAFHRRVRRAYRAFAEREPKRFRIIPAGSAPEKVHRGVLKAALPLLGLKWVQSSAFRQRGTSVSVFISAS